MKSKTPVPASPQPSKSFLQRYGVVLAVVVIIAIIAVSIISTVLVLRREASKPLVQKPVVIADLPGPKYQLSKRSKEQLDVLSRQNDNIVATFVTRSKYSKNESPVIHVWSRPGDKEVVDAAIKLVSGRGLSSEEVNALALKNPEQTARLLRDSEEAKLGLVKCLPVADVPSVDPNLKKISTGICYATIPPFESEASLAIVVITDTPLANYSDLVEMRRVLLALQIDIFNRDFQGRETWAHP